MIRCNYILCLFLVTTEQGEENFASLFYDESFSLSVLLFVSVSFLLPFNIFVLYLVLLNGNSTYVHPTVSRVAF